MIPIEKIYAVYKFEDRLFKLHAAFVVKEDAEKYHEEQTKAEVPGLYKQVVEQEAREFYRGLPQTMIR